MTRGDFSPRWIGWVFVFAFGPVLAHSPHDDVKSVAVAPSQGSGHTIYSLVRGNLLKSGDDARSWRRLIRGLDHKFELSALAVSTDGETLYVSSLGDGVYRSTDAGESWTHASGNLEELVIDRLAVAPWDSRVVLAGGLTEGLFRTGDGGDDWSFVKGSFAKITAIRFGASDTSPVLAGDHRGALFMSTDAGRTWQHMNSVPGDEAITAIAASGSAAVPGAVAIFIGTSAGKVFHSQDGGGSFLQVADTGDSKPIQSIELSPGFAEDGRVFVTGWDAGLLCGEARTPAWTPCSQGLTRDPQSRSLGTSSFNNLSLSPDFARDQTLYLAGFDGLFISTDGAEQWRHADTLSPFNIIGLGVSPDHARDETLMVTNLMWGAFISRNGGRSWKAINNGVIDQRRRNGLTCLFSAVFSPAFSEDHTLFTSTWWRILKSEDGGSSWRQVVPIEDSRWMDSHHGSTIAVSPSFATDGTVFVGTHTGLILKSIDRAESFEVVAQTDSLLGTTVFSPQYEEDRTLYVGGASGVHVSRDAGRTWEFSPLLDATRYAEVLVSPAHPPGEVDQFKDGVARILSKAMAVKLAVAAGDSGRGTIFAGTIEGLFRSHDHGLNWHLPDGTPFPQDGYIEAVAVSPDFEHDRMVIVSVRGHGHFVSEDGGESFARLSESFDASGVLLANEVGTTPPLSPIVFSPTFAADQTLYGFAGPMLFKSTDRGRHWEALRAPTADWRSRAHVWYRSLGRRYQYGYPAAAVGLLCLIGLAGVVVARRRTEPRTARGMPG